SDNIANDSAVTVASGAKLNLNNDSETIRSLADYPGGGGGIVTVDAGQLLTTGDSANTPFSGQITGAGGLFKQGSGTFTLSGSSNNYSGQTTINAGTLSVTGKLTGTSAASPVVLTGNSTTLTGGSSGRIENRGVVVNSGVTGASVMNFALISNTNTGG